MNIQVRCEKCGGTLAKWDAIGLDWIMYCINCGSEFYTREQDLKEQWADAQASGRPYFRLRSRLMTAGRR